MPKTSFWTYKLIFTFIFLVFVCSFMDSQGIDEKNDLQIYSDYAIPVITYHDISENPSAWNSFCIHPLQMEQDFYALRQLGFTTITVDEYIQIKKAYERKDKDKLYQLMQIYKNPILITVDDGYEGVYKYMYPLMKKYNIKANMYLISGEMEKKLPQFLTWEQVREMQESGLACFGNHSTVLHMKTKSQLAEMYYDPDLSQQVSEDYAACNAMIKSRIGTDVLSLAYPYGLYNEELQRIVAGMGIEFTFTTNYGISPFHSGNHELKRINRSFSYTTSDFLRNVNHLMQKNKYRFMGNVDGKAQEVAIGGLDIPGRFAPSLEQSPPPEGFGDIDKLGASVQMSYPGFNIISLKNEQAELVINTFTHAVVSSQTGAVHENSVMTTKEGRIYVRLTLLKELS